MQTNRFQLPAGKIQNLVTLANSGKRKAALKEAKLFEKSYPRDPALKNFIGVIYASIGNEDLAVKNFKSIIKNSPSYIPAYTNLANCFSQKCKYSDAIKTLNQALKAKKDAPDVFVALGANYQMNGELTNAIASYRSALALNPKHLEGWINLGNTLWESGKPKLASDAYIEALNISPNNNVAASYLIDTFHFVNSQKNETSPYCKANYDIKKLEASYGIQKFASNPVIYDFLHECEKILKINELTVNYRNTQIYRMPAKSLNCERHKSIFESHTIIPKFCFGCIKIQIDMSQVSDLVRLLLLFDKSDFLSKNIRKCMIEMREGVAGSYKGLIYCSNLQEAEGILKKLQLSLEGFTNCQPGYRIKRGCTEFDQAFPGYSKALSIVDEMMPYDPNWEQIEKNWDLNQPKRIFVPSSTVTGISLADFLIIKNWFAYGQKNDDKNARTKGY